MERRTWTPIVGAEQKWGENWEDWTPMFQGRGSDMDTHVPEGGWDPHAEHGAELGSM